MVCWYSTLKLHLHAIYQLIKFLLYHLIWVPITPVDAVASIYSYSDFKRSFACPVNVFDDFWTILMHYRISFTKFHVCQDNFHVKLVAV